jgi:hypothetical protein
MVFHTRSVAVIDDNRNVAYLNRNDSKRDLNLNNFDNDWNRNYRFLAVRHYSFFSRELFSGVLFANCRRHPPSILPISNICSDMRVYFFVSSARMSQASSSRSLKRSTLDIHLSRSIIFSAISE